MHDPFQLPTPYFCSDWHFYTLSYTLYHMYQASRGVAQDQSVTETTQFLSSEVTNLTHSLQRQKYLNMSEYLNTASRVPNHDADHQQPSGPPPVARLIPTSDFDSLYMQPHNVRPQSAICTTFQIPDDVLFQAPNAFGQAPSELFIQVPNNPLSQAFDNPFSQVHFQVPGGPFSQVSGGLSQVPDPAVQQNEDHVAQTKHGRAEPNIPFTCLQCFRTFRNDSELVKHGNNTAHKPYVCHCGGTFSRLDSLTRHCSEGQYPCPVCTKHDGNKAFTRHDHLLQHLRVAHKFDEKGIAWMRVRAPGTRRTRRPAGPSTRASSNA
ncbi:hypothetical protein F5B17DRAFT_435609 [Nemania serpens]|nr:hypothetical protein F5B17DRAFT_435609 [Nemania serpens]